MHGGFTDLTMLQIEGYKTAKSNFGTAKKKLKLWMAYVMKTQKLFAKEHEVQICLLKQKLWIKHSKDYCTNTGLLWIWEETCRTKKLILEWWKNKTSNTDMSHIFTVFKALNLDLRVFFQSLRPAGALFNTLYLLFFVCLLWLYFSPFLCCPFLSLPLSNLAFWSHEGKKKRRGQTLFYSNPKPGEETQIQPNRIYSRVPLQMVICRLSIGLGAGAPVTDTLTTTQLGEETEREEMLTTFYCDNEFTFLHFLFSLCFKCMATRFPAFRFTGIL